MVELVVQDQWLGKRLKEGQKDKHIEHGIKLWFV
jgi:hypothetical protein